MDFKFLREPQNFIVLCEFSRFCKTFWGAWYSHCLDQNLQISWECNVFEGPPQKKSLCQNFLTPTVVYYLFQQSSEPPGDKGIYGGWAAWAILRELRKENQIFRELRKSEAFGRNFRDFYLSCRGNE